jgi:glycosyltransferase involved in cell wall biosynthesis
MSVNNRQLSKQVQPDVSYLSQKKVLLAGYLAIHQIEQFRDYLLKRVGFLGFIGLTTFEVRGVKPECMLYEKGDIVRRFLGPFRLRAGRLGYKIALPVSYFVHLISIILLSISFRTIFDIYIGVSYTPALAGVFLKRVGLAKSLVYYSFDYAPTPPRADFYTTVTTRMFQILDSVCANSSDVVWNLSNAMIRIRQASGLKKAQNLQIVVPYPISPRPARDKNINRNSAVFMGNLRPGQGVELVIDALPMILDHVPDFRFVIIGTGPHEGELKETARRRKLEEHIAFLGFIRDQEEAERILSSCSIGLAPYLPDPYSVVSYAYPGKVRTYLECGIPVVMTKVSDIAKQIDMNGAGFAVEYDARQLANAIVKLLTDDKLFRRFKTNVRRMAAASRQQDILDEAFTVSKKRLLK